MQVSGENIGQTTKLRGTGAAMNAHRKIVLADDAGASVRPPASANHHVIGMNIDWVCAASVLHCHLDGSRIEAH